MKPVNEDIKAMSKIDMDAFDSILFSKNVSSNIFGYIRRIFNCNDSFTQHRMVMISVKNSVIPTI